MKRNLSVAVSSDDEDAEIKATERSENDTQMRIQG